MIHVARHAVDLRSVRAASFFTRGGTCSSIAKLQLFPPETDIVALLLRHELAKSMHIVRKPLTSQGKLLIEFGARCSFFGSREAPLIGT